MRSFERIGRGNTDDLHAGASRSLDSDQRVLENDAPLRGNAKKLRGLQEDVRRRLAVDNVIPAHHARRTPRRPVVAKIDSRFVREVEEPTAQGMPAA